MGFVIGFLIFAIGGFICRDRLARWLLWGTVLAGAFAGLGLVWPTAQFDRAGCVGSPLSGMTCPDMTALTQIAVLHSGFAIYFFVFGVIALPVVGLIALVIEARARRTT